MKHFVSVFAIVTIPFLSLQKTSAGNLVDDFTEISGSFSYPVTHDVTMPGTLEIDAPLASTIAPARSLFLSAGRPFPSTTPPPEEVNLTVNVDPNVGELTSVASDASTTFLVLGWTNEAISPPNADLTSDTHMAIDYSSNVDLNLRVALSNIDTNGDTQGANRATTSMAAGTNLRFLVPLADINEDIIDISTFPDNFPFPPVDLSSVDSFALELTTAITGAEFTITQVAFVNIPEPGSLGLTLASVVLASLRCGRRLPSRR